jgi:hypothetical protein
VYLPFSLIEVNGEDSEQNKQREGEIHTKIKQNKDSISSGIFYN